MTHRAHRRFSLPGPILSASTAILSLALVGCETTNGTNAPAAPQAPAPVARPAPPPGPPPVATPAPVAPAQPEIALTPPPGVTQTIPVGLLVPLSGEHAAMGQSLLNAAQLAVFEVADKRFELQPRDTAGTPEGARAAAEQALNTGSRLLLGPVFAANTRDAAAAARERGVNLIAFTNDRDVAGAGAFVIGLLPGDRVDRVVSYAASRGVRRFAALIPEGLFGDRVLAEYQSAVARHGGQMVRVARYAPDQQSAIAAVKRLGDYDARRADVQRRRNALKAAGDAASLRELKRLEARETLGDAPFDAVLLLEAGGGLTAVAPLLPYYEIDTRKVRILGILDWSAPEIRREAAMAGAWYAGPDPDAIQAFAERYRGVYGQYPHPLASLAYDATALAAVLAQTGVPEGAATDPERVASAFAADRIAVANGFAGSSGLFRFQTDGQVEHKFAVMEVQPDGIRVVSPTPTAFDDVPVASAPGS